MPEDREQRVMDLATGFALGELTDDELREFYDVLREPGDSGQEAGRLAWETLGTCIDLRAQMGSTFQDTLFLKLSESAGAGNANFATRVRSRLGHSRPRLQPVDAPAANPRSSWLGIMVAVILMVIVVAATSPWWWPQHEPPVAQVISVVGGVSRDGRALAVGDAVDRRQIVVGTSAQVTLLWPDGNEAIVAGPAGIVAGNQGLSVLSGGAWCRTTAPFSLGLPDRQEALVVPAASAIAIEIRDSHTTIALARGQIEASRLQITTNQAVDLLQPNQPYPWRSDDLPRGVTTDIGSPQARWSLTGGVAFRETEAAVVLRLQLSADSTAELFLAPGSAALRLDGKELQRLALGGAPLAERDVVVQASGNVLSVAIGGQKLEVPLPIPVSRMSWDGVAGELRNARFSTGPAPKPPFPSEGW